MLNKHILNLCGAFQLGAAVAYAAVGWYGWATFALAFAFADFALAAARPHS